MLTYLLIGIIILIVILIIVLITVLLCVLLRKKKKNKKNTGKLPTVNSMQYIGKSDNVSDMKGSANPAFSFAADHNSTADQRYMQGDTVFRPAENNVCVDPDATISMDMTAGEAAFLIDRRGNQQLLITKPAIVIGTDTAKADFIIRDNKVVSRQHALLYKRNNGYFITDNHSTNHTYVNEIRLMPGEMRQLSAGDTIRVANVTLEFIFR